MYCHNKNITKLYILSATFTITIHGNRKLYNNIFFQSKIFFSIVQIFDMYEYFNILK